MTDKFCKFCGNEHVEKEFPLKCSHCNTITWFSPSPVAVLLQSTYNKTTGKIGIVIGRRMIEPQLGKYGLVGGYIDSSDPIVEMAAAREFFEETGIKIRHERMKIDHSYSDGKHLLIFVHNADILDEEYVLNNFVPNSECDHIRIAYAPEELCFVSHTEALAKFFKKIEA